MREHVEPPAVRHAQHHAPRALRSRQLDREIEHRHQHVEPLDREALLAEVGAMQEALERLDRRESREQLALLVGREGGPVLSRLDHVAQPQALLVAADVLDFVGDRAAIGAQQLRIRVGERGAGNVNTEDVRRDARHVLEGKTERAGVERRVAGGIGAERVEPCRHVAEVADGFHEGHGGGDGAQVIGRRDTGNGKRGFHGNHVSRFPFPASRQAQALHDPLIEAIFALQQPLDPLQEPPRLRTLDYAVVVGARDCHHLGGADLADRARGDDRALALHQARHRGDRAESAGVRERDGGAGEIVGEELVGARSCHEPLVRRAELREVHRLGVLDHGDDEGAAAVLLSSPGGRGLPARSRNR